MNTKSQRVELDEFTTAYIKCALWSTTDDDDDKALGPGDGPNETESMSHGKTADDCDAAFIAQAIGDCAKFQAAHAERIGDDAEHAGYDFWLSRNGHGVGFFDGDWPEPDGDILQEDAESYGEVYLYLNNDGRVYDR